jgi:hypothetical protein
MTHTTAIPLAVPLDVAQEIDRLSDESGESLDTVIELLLRAALISHERMTENRAELEAA